MTMKAYTDFEQSKKLAEILPIESADMSYRPYREEGGIPDYQATLCPHIFASWIGIPCWSLAALLEQIPVTAEYKDVFIRLRIDKGNVGHDEYAMWYDDLQTNLSTDIETEADNFVDACVAMILKLHEQKLI